jgi:hypothetical protein
VSLVLVVAGFVVLQRQRPAAVGPCAVRRILLNVEFELVKPWAASCRMRRGWSTMRIQVVSALQHHHHQRLYRYITMSDQDTSNRDPPPALKKAKTTSVCSDSPFRYSCEIEVTFPTAKHAQLVLQVLQVDQEIGERATKTLSLCSCSCTSRAGHGNGVGGDGHGDDLRILRM